MIKGTGVDIIEISRIEKSLTNEKFIERIFTKKECKNITANNVYSTVFPLSPTQTPPNTYPPQLS